MQSRRGANLALLLFFLGWAVGLASCGTNETPEELRRHVEYLASDELAGRGVGTEGIALAERHIAGVFRSYGLEPLPGQVGYFLRFPLYEQGFDLEATSLILGSGEVSGSPGQDFRPFDFSDGGARSAQVVFAGYGITAPEYGYDDYAGLEVRGKFVLVLRHEPGNEDPRSIFEGTAATRHSYFIAKASNARSRRAAGMILVDDPLTPGQPEELSMQRSLSLHGQASADTPEAAGSRGPGSGGEESFLAIHVSRQLAGALLRGTGLSLAELQQAVDGGRKPAAFDLGEVSARIRVGRLDSRPLEARNVVGFLEGSDPVLKKQWILIAAHHDHLGSTAGQGDTVFNGADDNASGVSGVLALARLFAREGIWTGMPQSEPDGGRGAAGWAAAVFRRPVRPRRSLVFATFSAEEQGLFGSRVLAERLLPGESAQPAERVVFMVNLDMIGRNEQQPVQVLGDGFTRGLRRLVELAAREEPEDLPRSTAGRKNSEIATAAPLPLRFSGSSHVDSSDHAPFFEKGVPYLFFFTGTHEDYHGTGDEAEKLDYPHLARVVRLAWRVISLLAQAQSPPSPLYRVSWLGLELAGEQPRAPTPVNSGFPAEPVGALVTSVEPGSPAERSSFRPGDEILAVGGQSPARLWETARLLSEVDAGRSAVVRVRRGGEELEISAVRAYIGYLGIVPKAWEPEEGERVVVSRLAPDGPAARAGLRAGDVILRVAGRPVDTASLGVVLEQAGAGRTVELAVLREGRPLTLSLTLSRRP